MGIFIHASVDTLRAPLLQGMAEAHNQEKIFLNVWNQTISFSHAEF